jgi:hypothetical protein
VGSATGSASSSSLIKGIPGGTGQRSGGVIVAIPNSGCCPLFGGGVVSVLAADGTTGTVYGEGGGAARSTDVATNYSGGAGFKGVIRVWEYY